MRIQQMLFILWLFSCWGIQTTLANEDSLIFLVVKSVPTDLFPKKDQKISEEELKLIKLGKGKTVTLMTWMKDQCTGIFTLTGNASKTPTRRIEDMTCKEALDIMVESERDPWRDGGKKPPQVWMANIDVGGHYCALDNSITLWRSHFEKAVTFVIESDNDEEREIRFAVQECTHAFVFQEGKEYWFFPSYAEFEPRSFTFYQIPPEIKAKKDKFERVLWMAKKGCIQQAAQYMTGVQKAPVENCVK